MKREDLKAFNLSDDDVQKIMDLHGADIEKQKRSIETLTAERNDFKSRLEEANSKLEGYDPEWKTKAEQAQADADTRIQKIQRGYLLKETAGGIKFSSESAKKAFLSDLEAAELPVQEDKILGFEDFLKQYRDKDPSAFLPDKPVPAITVPGQGPAAKKTGQQFLDEKYKNNPFYRSKGE